MIGPLPTTFVWTPTSEVLRELENLHGARTAISSAISGAMSHASLPLCVTPTPPAKPLGLLSPSHLYIPDAKGIATT